MQADAPDVENPALAPKSPLNPIEIFFSAGSSMEDCGEKKRKASDLQKSEAFVLIKKTAVIHELHPIC